MIMKGSKRITLGSLETADGDLQYIVMLLINSYYLHVNQTIGRGPLSSFHGVNVAEGRMSDRECCAP